MYWFLSFSHYGPSIIHLPFRNPNLKVIITSISNPHNKWIRSALALPYLIQYKQDTGQLWNYHYRHHNSLQIHCWSMIRSGALIPVQGLFPHRTVACTCSKARLFQESWNSQQAIIWSNPEKTKLKKDNINCRGDKYDVDTGSTSTGICTLSSVTRQVASISTGWVVVWHVEWPV